MGPASPTLSIPDAPPIDEYRLVRRLGRGDGDGDVLLALDRTLDRAVVLRFLPRDPKAARCLLEGARALAQLSHPSLCPVYRIRERGERAGVACVVQGFERGERLDVVTRARGGSMERGEVLSIGRALAGALTALHGADIAHGEVRPDRIILSSSGMPHLFGLHGARIGAAAEARARDVADLVGLLERIADRPLREALAERAGRGQGALSADDLVRALDELSRSVVPVETSIAGLAADPYPGLRPFEAEYASLFFGRQREIDEALERLRVEPWLLITAPSGAGKSSLVRAGLVPAIAAGALGERVRWNRVIVTPGARPLSALAAALAPLATRTQRTGELEAELRAQPVLASRLAASRTDAGLLLVVDQLEEALLLAEPAERDAFFAALAAFGTLVPGVRAIATLRADFLDRLSALGTAGRDLLRAGYVLPPMSIDGLRQAIVGPARARGFEIETPAIVDALVAEAAASEGGNGLPLVSFAAAALWHERDGERRVLTEVAFRRLGGAAAALARHSETVLASLTNDERAHARRILLALVTPSETRARCTRPSLVGEGGGSAEAALEALVRGRLVVAGETYTIAHEALVDAWPRLRTWLDQASDARRAQARLAAAARDWARLGRRTELLWSAAQLRALEIPGALDGADSVARSFVDASRSALRRARLRRGARRAVAPAALSVLTAAVAGWGRWSEQRDVHVFVAARVAEAEPLIQHVVDLDVRVTAARADAFSRYDANDTAVGEQRWKEALSLAQAQADAFAAASAPLGLALARDPAEHDLRGRFADLALLWLLAAERDHETDVAADLEARLAQLDDDGSRRARLIAPAHLTVTAAASGAQVRLLPVRVDAGGRRVEDGGRAIDLGAPIALAPGSYVLEGSAPDRFSTRFPVLLRRAENAHVEIPLPLASAVPPGFVFVPAGTSLLGAPDVEGVRVALLSEPEHPVRVDAFLIGEHEVTYGEYLEFLASLPLAERAVHVPRAPHLRLDYDTEGVPVLTMGGGDRQATARRGNPFCYFSGAARRCQNWLRFPVGGITKGDAGVYFRWLAAKVPGARPCAAREWERAARGADGRRYAHGDILHPDDANIGPELAGDENRIGVFEVGSFPLDRSPFGVLDLNGNGSEWVAAEGLETRGGDWTFGNSGFSARAASPTMHLGGRSPADGMRACADAPKNP